MAINKRNRLEAEADPAYWAEQRRDRTTEWVIADVLPTAVLSAVIIASVVLVGSSVWPLWLLALPAAWFIRSMWREILDRD